MDEMLNWTNLDILRLFLGGLLWNPFGLMGTQRTADQGTGHVIHSMSLWKFDGRCGYLLAPSMRHSTGPSYHPPHNFPEVTLIWLVLVCSFPPFFSIINRSYEYLFLESNSKLLNFASTIWYYETFDPKVATHMSIINQSSISVILLI